MKRLLLVAIAALLCAASMQAFAVTSDSAMNQPEVTAADSLALTPPDILPGAAPAEMLSPEPLDDIELDSTSANPIQNDTDPALDQDTARAQAAPQVKRKLLPDDMSWFERTVWGEDGVLRSIGIASPLTPEVRKSELGVRRTMLTMHQIGGFVTLGLMGAAVVYGQRYLNNFQRSDRSNHQTFVTLTLVSYGLTAALAALSPPPFIRRGETSTTSIHKTLAWVHFAGMIVTPILGAVINRRGTDYLTQARYHQVAAYITTAVFTTAMVVMTF